MPVGGQPGNKNAAKSRLFDDAFRRELKQRDLKAGDGETIRMIVANIVDMALAKDLSAFKEMRDTVDGKPAQSVELTGEITNRAALISDDELAEVARAGNRNPA